MLIRKPSVKQIRINFKKQNYNSFHTVEKRKALTLYLKIAGARL